MVGVIAALSLDGPDVAGWIRRVRVRAGLSQTELARLLGTKQPVVSRWESGRDEPRLSTLSRIARACGLRLVLSAEFDDVDRAQIRQMLAMSPEQRLAGAENLSRLLAEARPVS